MSVALPQVAWSYPARMTTTRGEKKQRKDDSNTHNIRRSKKKNIFNASEHRLKFCPRKMIRSLKLETIKSFIVVVVVVVVVVVAGHP